MTLNYQAYAHILWPAGIPEWSRIWVILDCARDKQIYSRVYASRANKVCLYAGYLPPALERAAPWLVELDQEDQFTHWLLGECKGKSWGIFFRCEGPITSVRKHFRRFLTVIGPGGGQLLFRYYDPRVLRTYLPTCTSEELRYVFGPVERFYTELPQEHGMQEFLMADFRLVSREYLAAQQ